MPRQKRSNSRSCSARSGPASLIANRQPRVAVVGPQAPPSTCPAGGPVDERVLDQVRQRAAKRLLVGPDDEPARRHPSCTRLCGPRGPRQRPATSSSSATGSSAALGAVGALERQQVVDEARQAGGAGAQFGEQLVVGTVTCGVLDVAEQRRDRSAELVRGVGEEPALCRARGASSEASIRFSTPVSCPISSACSPVSGSRRDGSAVRSISPPRRPAAAAARARGASARRPRSPRQQRHARPDQPEDEAEMRTVFEMSVVSEATSTAPPAAGPPACAIGAAYTRNERPAIRMSSNRGRPRDERQRERASPGGAAARRASASGR